MINLKSSAKNDEYSMVIEQLLTKIKAINIDLDLLIFQLELQNQHSEAQNTYNLNVLVDVDVKITETQQFLELGNLHREQMLKYIN